ncbi:MAG: ExbD/TolR family protein [Oligoflexus sp.]
MAGKKKRHSKKGPAAPELNIMPFIDIFSMLNTFLLVSAAFIGLGIIEVQIPFLSNAPELQTEPSRDFSIRVDVEEAQVILTTQWTAEPVEKRVENYKLETADLERFHQEMMRLRVAVPETDKVTVYSDDNVKYDRLILVLDAIKTLNETDPPLNIPRTSDESDVRRSVSDRSLYEKVVIGSVIL